MASARLPRWLGSPAWKHTTGRAHARRSHLAGRGCPHHVQLYGRPDVHDLGCEASPPIAVAEQRRVDPPTFLCCPAPEAAVAAPWGLAAIDWAIAGGCIGLVHRIGAGVS